MNRIRVKITNIANDGDVALVKLESLDLLESSTNSKTITSSNDHVTFTALVLDFANNLAIGNECNVVFKESEIMIASLDSHISARNRFISRIADIECDEIFARIFLDFMGQTITSLITKESITELNIKKGDEIMWFVKASEVMVEFK